MAIQPGAIPGLLGDALWNNPYGAGKRYMDQYEQGLPGMYNPYMQRGERAGAMEENQIGQLLGDPGGRLNQIGEGYHKSPGYNYALHQALQGGSNAAAAGGMAGTPQHQQQAMQTATGMANQDYNNWLSKALGMYGQGMQGANSLYSGGLNATEHMSGDLGSVLGAQASRAQSEADAKNKHNSSWIHDIGSFFGL